MYVKGMRLFMRPPSEYIVNNYCTYYTYSCLIFFGVIRAGTVQDDIE